MKKLNTYIISLISALGFLCLSSCQTKDILLPSGDMIESEDLETPTIPHLHCKGSDDELVQVIMSPGETNVVKDFYLTFNKPSSSNQTFAFMFGGKELVEQYSAQNNIDCEILHESYVTYDGDGTMLVPAGNTCGISKEIYISTTNRAGNKLSPGRYVLPIKVVTTENTNVIFIDLIVREPFQKDIELYTGQDMFTVFYVNTGQFDPRLITDFCLEYWNVGEARSTIDIGNILNLRKSQVRWDIDESRPILNLYPDLKYVLDHNWKYILPVQESGRKVCLCVEGGGQGIGFCNLNEVQIEDLTGQIVDVVERYQLDGVNLWDRGSNYGKEGMPAFDETSYPKFIKTLRQKLGRRRLLTLVDYEEPTESFGDKAVCGGIEVGKYIDYAWSGYCDNRENIQVVDPYHPDAEGVSDIHVRKPILGLTEKRYGCLNAYWRSNNMPFSIYDDLIKYEKLDIRPSGLFVFGEDIRSNLQDQYEGEATPAQLLYQISRSHQSKLRIQMGRRWGGDNYGKWLKDW